MRCYDIPVDIAANDCEAAFTFMPDTSVNQYNYHFINLSKGNATNYLWNFGDKDSIKVNTLKNVTHIYSIGGIYNVCLTAYRQRGNGCNNKYCLTIFVSDKPSTCKAYFTDLPGYNRIRQISTGLLIYH